MNAVDRCPVRIVLVRHGAVEVSWRKKCYGQLDVPLCDQWQASSKPLIQSLAMLEPSFIYHSGLHRTQWLAEQVFACESAYANRSTRSCIFDKRLRERTFGSWEGQTWDDVFASDPENFHGLIDHPKTYRPPGGETTWELQCRMVDWYKSVLSASSAELRAHSGRCETILAISHSGPIASLAGHLLGKPANQWQEWMVAYGDAITISVQHERTNQAHVTLGLP